MPNRFFGEIVIFSGMANEPLAQGIANHLKQKLGVCTEPRRHKDGEIWIRYGENIRHKDVFIIQPTNQPDSNLTELLFMTHAAVLASACRITAVMPYFGYARADKKTAPREEASATLIVSLLKQAGVDRIILLDVHSEVVQGCCRSHNIQTDALWARPIFASYFREHPEEAPFLKKELVVVAPDEGATRLARAYAKSFSKILQTHIPIAIIEKRRPEAGEVDVLNVIGDVTHKDVLMVDDLIDSGKTLCKGALALKEEGAYDIYALGSHGVLSDGSHARLALSIIKKVFITDSIYQNIRFPELNIVSIAPLLAETIRRTHIGESVSSLFEEEYQ